MHNDYITNCSIVINFVLYISPRGTALLGLIKYQRGVTIKANLVKWVVMARVLINGLWLIMHWYVIGILKHKTTCCDEYLGVRTFISSITVYCRMEWKTVNVRIIFTRFFMNRGPSQYKDAVLRTYEFSLYTIKWPHDRLIIKMEIHALKDRLYIETEPRLRWFVKRRGVLMRNMLSTETEWLSHR